MRFFSSVVLFVSLAVLCLSTGAEGQRLHKPRGRIGQSMFSHPLYSGTPVPEFTLQQMFTAFVKEHNKKYTHDEFPARFETFKSNCETIRKHNIQPGVEFTMGLNAFADLSSREFKQKYFGYKKPSHESAIARSYHQNVGTAPDSIDWRAKGAVTPIKNQGQCGSCWAFSAVGAIEGAWVVQGHHPLVALSEQWLVDCDKVDKACSGGSMDQAFQFVIDNHGICSEESYPYSGSPGDCKNCTKAATISSYKDVPANSESSLLNAVGTMGPVSVAIEADQQAFQFYATGVFGATCGTSLDHGVLAVGYGTDSGKDYWIVKNSWGASWGEQGYIRMARGVGASGICGIAMDASYPIV